MTAHGNETSEIEDTVIDKIRSRRELGRKKYGTTMEREDLTKLQWLQHLQDELLDGAIYAERLMREERGPRAVEELPEIDPVNGQPVSATVGKSEAKPEQGGWIEGWPKKSGLYEIEERDGGFWRGLWNGISFQADDGVHYYTAGFIRRHRPLAVSAQAEPMPEAIAAVVQALKEHDPEWLESAQVDALLAYCESRWSGEGEKAELRNHAITPSNNPVIPDSCDPKPQPPAPAFTVEKPGEYKTRDGGANAELRSRIAALEEENSRLKRELSDVDEIAMRNVELAHENIGLTGKVADLTSLRAAHDELVRRFNSLAQADIEKAEELERLRVEVANHFADLRKVREWMASDRRPELAFTAGPEREIADVIAQAKFNLAAKDARIAELTAALQDLTSKYTGRKTSVLK